MKKHRLLFHILLDVVCFAAALIVFALFHHVLPRQEQSLGIVIENPYRTQQDTADGEDTSGLAFSDYSLLTASGGVSDTSVQVAWGRRRNGGPGGGSGSGEKGGSALTDDGEDTEIGTDDTPISEKFSDKYTDTVVITENSYSSPDISITVTEETIGWTTYYLADIYVRDITCFQSALAQNTYGTGFRDSISDMALLNNAIPIIQVFD